MTELRFDEAAHAALAAEARAGTPVLVLREGAGRDGDAREVTDRLAAIDRAEDRLPDERAPEDRAPDEQAPDEQAPRGRPTRPGAEGDELIPGMGGGLVRVASIGAANLVGVAAGAALRGLRAVVELGGRPGGLARALELATLADELDGASALLDCGAAQPGAPGDDGSAPGGEHRRRGHGVVVRLHLSTGATGDAAALERDLLALVHVRSLAVAVPATPASCFGLVRAAIGAPGHVLVLEPDELATTSGDVDPAAARLPLGQAEVVRRGGALTVVAAQAMLGVALEVADLLEGTGHAGVEVIDPRWLVPFDDETVAASLSRTARLLVLDDGPLARAWGSALIARLTAGHFGLFDAPPRLVAGAGAGGDLPAALVARVASELAAY